MTKNRISTTGTYRKIACLQISIVLAITLSFSQETTPFPDQTNFENEWFYPIIQKHKIDLSKFNYRATFTIVNSDNTIMNNWLELGNCDSLNNKNIKLKDALIIALFDTSVGRNNRNMNYWILSSSVLQHDFENKTISTGYCKHIWYDINEKEIIPLQPIEGSMKFFLNSDMKMKESSYKIFTP
jgi:hypothetical protein